MVKIGKYTPRDCVNSRHIPVLQWRIFAASTAATLPVRCLVIAGCYLIYRIAVRAEHCSLSTTAAAVSDQFVSWAFQVVVCFAGQLDTSIYVRMQMWCIAFYSNHPCVQWQTLFRSHEKRKPNENVLYIWGKTNIRALYSWCAFLSSVCRP
jgi:hypothetical protein